MQQLQVFLVSALSCLLITYGNSLQAQGIEWDKDTIPESSAISARFRLSNDLNAAGRKATKYVDMNISKLKEVIDACAAKGINNIQFWMTSLRREDVAQYALRNPGLTEQQKNDLIGRQIIIIKVPRSVFNNAAQQSMGYVPVISHLMISIMMNGVLPNKLFASGYTYMSFGSICPPPDNCGD